MNRPKLAKILILALIANFASLLFGSYAEGEQIHEVRNGLPLPFITQRIEIRPGRLLGLELMPLNFGLDVCFWVALVFLVNSWPIHRTAEQKNLGEVQKAGSSA